MDRELIRRNSITTFDNIGIKIPSHLPLLESDSELSYRSATEVAKKISALGFVIGMGYEADHSMLIEKIEKAKLWQFVSPLEKDKLENPSGVSKQDRINCQWLSECIYGLAWCLALVDEELFEEVPDNLSSITVPGNPPLEFIKNKTLRHKEDILQRADLYYCLHWYERSCRLENKKGLVGESVAWERRRALDWVIGVSDDWDDMPSDT